MLGISENIWLPLLTLILGYTFSLLTEAFRNRQQTSRERQARRDEREDAKAARDEEIAQRRRDFQRSTLLELQEVLHDLGRTYGHEHYADVKNYRTTGSWKPRPMLDEDMNQMSQEAYRRSSILLSRIYDNQLRTLVRAMKDQGSGLLLAESEEESAAALARSMEAFVAANERIGELLQTTY